MCFTFKIIKVSIVCPVGIKLDWWISIPEMSRQLDLFVCFFFLLKACNELGFPFY
jgi:hypothetical protein